MKRNVILALAAVIFAGIQFHRPPKTNPPVDPAKVKTAPPAVDAIFRRACYDCHSHETKWPFYSYVAPMSWFVTGHVDKGRRHVNFSDWEQPDPIGWGDPGEQYKQICDQVKSGGMPLTSYLLLHWGARVSKEDAAAICAWTSTAE